MYEFDNEAGGVNVYGDYHGHGFRITDLDAAKEVADFNSIRPYNINKGDFNKGCYFPSLREGNVVFVQKGRKERMKNPFIVDQIDYAVNANVPSIKVKFVPTNSQSVEVSIYAQLPEDPMDQDEPVLLNRYADYVSPKDNSWSGLADNANFWIVPDEIIMEALSDAKPHEALHLVI